MTILPATRVRRSVEHPATQPARARGLIDRRVAAALFVLLTLGLPTHAGEMFRAALDDATARGWLLFADAGLRTLVWAAFAVFIYRRKPSRRPSRSPKAFLACAGAIVPAMFIAPPGADAALAAVVAGELVVVVAVGFTLASVVCLGPCFGVLPVVRGLVMRGPYRYVRHPVYLGEIAAFAGFVLASQQLANVPALLVFCVAQAVRLRLEEEALLEAFPEEYGAFAARTPRLIPRFS
jgi:protein-S-isoprenylcysteine O-methyltransferase Ste14